MMKTHVISLPSFRDPDFLEGLAYRKTRKSEKGVLQDIQDGSEYQRILKTRFLDHPYNFTIGFNTDGVSPYKSSNLELWPIFWMVHNLSKNMRFRVKYTRLYGLYYGKKKSNMNTFFRPFRTEMTEYHDSANDVNLNLLIIISFLSFLLSFFFF